MPNGTVYPASVHAELQEALQALQARPEAARFSLLVAPEGMSYDPGRLGGDPLVRVGSGRNFTLLV